MVLRRMDDLLRYVRRIASPPGAATEGDGLLLERFFVLHDETAFESLLRRHGPMVLGVCRRVLPDTHAVEEAFQATFLVFLRKAHALRQRERLAAWLYGVAYRIALKARAQSGRRRALEQPVADLPGEDSPDLRGPARFAASAG